VELSDINKEIRKDYKLNIRNMYKDKFNLRNVVVIAICLAVTTIFSGCEKEDYNKLEGTKWEAETDIGIFTLRFEESVCYFGSGRKDGTFSANLTTYDWKYTPDMYGARSLFHLYEDETTLYYGTVENKELHLHMNFNVENIEPLRFKRTKW
jgi:hypothetical protein